MIFLKIQKCKLAVFDNNLVPVVGVKPVAKILEKVFLSKFEIFLFKSDFEFTTSQNLWG